MELRYTERFRKSYERAPASIRKAFDKQALFLKGSLLHPSLRAKKYDESRNWWQARVTRDWRFYFRIDVYSSESRPVSPEESGHPFQRKVGHPLPRESGPGIGAERRRMGSCYVLGESQNMRLYRVWHTRVHYMPALASASSGRLASAAASSNSFA